MTEQDYLDYIKYVQTKEASNEDALNESPWAFNYNAAGPQSYGQWLTSDGDPKIGSQYPYILPAFQGDAMRAIKRGYLYVPEIETGDDADTRNLWGSLKPGDKVPIDKNGWYKIPDDVDPGVIRVPPGSYVNALNGRFVPPGGAKPTSPYDGKAMDYDTSTKWYDYAGQFVKSATGPLQGEPGGGKHMSELQGANWFIGKVAAMGAAAGGGSDFGTGDVGAGGQEIMTNPDFAYGQGSSAGQVGTGDFDANGNEIMANPNTAYGSGYQQGPTLGSQAWNYAKDKAISTAKDFAINQALKALSPQGGAAGGAAGTSGGTGLRTPSAFDVEDTPLSTEFSDNEKIIDNLLKKAGETGDYATAVEAVNSFQTIAANRTELEKEVQKYKDDPDFKAIEPEIRATTEEAIQKGMTPKQATAYAFEKAKKERTFSEYLKEYQMRKKLELAGLTGREAAA